MTVTLIGQKMVRMVKLGCEVNVINNLSVVTVTGRSKRFPNQYHGHQCPAEANKAFCHCVERAL